MNVKRIVQSLSGWLRMLYIRNPKPFPIRSRLLPLMIEGRTPYNANHTKNVAKRCIEMMDYINRMHKEKKNGFSFFKGG